MHTLTLLAKRGLIITMVVVLLGATPTTVFADPADTTPAATSAQPGDQSTSSASSPAKTTNGTSSPTGSSAHTYSYNASSGLWENAYYTWNPNTKETLPKYTQEYTYNPSTGMWDSFVWQYSAASGVYKSVPLSVATPPANAITYGGPELVAQPEQLSSSTPTDTSKPLQNTSSAAMSSSTLPEVGNGGTDVSKTNALNQNLEFATSGRITNFLNSTSRSGNAIIIANTTAGNAQSGDAASIANVFNLLQSNSGFGNADFAQFTANIQGNVQGDLMIDPAQFAQPANISQQNLANLKINNSLDGSIQNNINLGATSGDASAYKNTTAGNVTTGNADAIANVVNMINSVVAANQSFLGTINIYGNYFGNILVPTESLNAVLASTGPNTSNNTKSTTNINTSLTNNTSETITNNTNLSATTGTATVDSNTSGGSATTGNALTNLTILNLTGRQINAANSLLVFVNVLGKWVGLIMDAPAGTTAAAVGGGVTSNSTTAVNADITNNEKKTIENNITLAAKTGNASATKNTNAGNATSGNATASANIANVMNSNFNISQWFGILFINVFGTWNGNFGAAKPVVTPVVPGSGGVSSVAGSLGGGIKDMKVFRFTPSSDSESSQLGLSPLSSSDENQTSDELMQQVSTVLAARTNTPSANKQAATLASDPNEATSLIAVLPFVLGIAGLSFVALDRYREIRRRS